MTTKSSFPLHMNRVRTPDFIIFTKDILPSKLTRTPIITFVMGGFNFWQNNIITILKIKSNITI